MQEQRTICVRDVKKLPKWQCNEDNRALARGQAGPPQFVGPVNPFLFVREI
jgi:hypothetical protein